jgi:hypothetical protein
VKAEKGRKNMDKKTLYESCELEIIIFGKSDIIQTSGGTLDFDGDGGNQGPPDDSWT